MKENDDEIRRISSLLRIFVSEYEKRAFFVSSFLRVRPFSFLPVYLTSFSPLLPPRLCFLSFLLFFFSFCLTPVSFLSFVSCVIGSVGYRFLFFSFSVSFVVKCLCVCVCVCVCVRACVRACGSPRASACFTKKGARREARGEKLPLSFLLK